MPASELVPNPGPLLVVEGVVKRFGGHTALGGISLSIHPGEFIALAGRHVIETVAPRIDTGTELVTAANAQGYKK